MPSRVTAAVSNLVFKAAAFGPLSADCYTSRQFAITIMACSRPGVTGAQNLRKYFVGFVKCFAELALVSFT